MQALWFFLSLFLSFCLYYILKNRLAVFFPSSKEMIKVIIGFADIKKNDVFYDLGSGDGRILVEAAKEGIKVVGIEKNRLLNWFTRKKIKKFKNVNVIQGDVFKQKINDASIIVAYLSQKVTERLQKKIEKEVKKGTRIILVDHKFLNWKPVKIKKVGLVSIRLYIKKK
jgi:16S rRNA A1518/A1519 N6-dimethyltransferase RsmA/KsgA/DIM1 with predicted DNA glycosylase/AP lyase activity